MKALAAVVYYLIKVNKTKFIQTLMLFIRDLDSMSILAKFVKKDCFTSLFFYCSTTVKMMYAAQLVWLLLELEFFERISMHLLTLFQ